MKNQWLFSICLFVCLPALAQDKDKETLSTLNVPEIWNQVPGTWLETVSGEKITAEKLQGKVLILNFWFIGCMPCMKELPYLNALYERYKDNDEVIFLSIAPHGEDDIQKFINPTDTTFIAIRNYFKVPKGEAIIKYPIIAVCAEKEVKDRKYLRPDCHEDLASRFSLRGYPLTLLVNRSGKVSDIRNGFPIDEEGKPNFIAEIESLIGQ